jgi:predicted PurR-regulated permease PerM
LEHCYPEVLKSVIGNTFNIIALKQNDTSISGLKLQQLAFLGLIATLFWVIFWNLRLFLPALLGAYTLYVLLRQPLHYCTDRWKVPAKVGAAALMLLSFVIILIPVNALVQMLGSKIMAGLQQSEQISQQLQVQIGTFERQLGVSLLTPERLASFTAWGLHEASVLLNATLSGLLMVVVAYFLLWFMLTDSKKMESSFFNWLPLQPEQREYVRHDLNNLVFSNALGIPLMGVVQGLAGLIGYWMAGIEEVWFWVLVTFIAGMMPFLGVMLAFIPLSLLLLSNGQTGQALFIMAYGLVVIGSVDNLARMWLLKKIGHTHPLITLFGVIIGLQLFGFIGFIFGPILIAMFLLLIKIYIRQYPQTSTPTP